MQSKGATGPAFVATEQIAIVAKEIHLFGESSRLSLTKEAELTGEGGGVSVADRDPKLQGTPREVKTIKLNVRILDAQRRPMRNKRYLLTVDGKPYEKSVSGRAGPVHSGSFWRRIGRRRRHE